jgi:hypothetical protein
MVQYDSPKSYRPEFIRLPSSGQQCPYTGLSRAKMNQLILPCPENGGKPPVHSISLGPAGKKGVRLIEYKSLITFLRSHLSEGAVA